MRELAFGISIMMDGWIGFCVGYGGEKSCVVVSEVRRRRGKYY